MLTVERLREVLDYNPETGWFVWKIRMGRKHGFPGERAGDVNKGYRRISIEGHKYPEHRLAWLYTYGSWPVRDEVDHWNGIKTDNRIANLRDATHAQNKQNRFDLQRNNTSGHRGAVRYGGRWMARIQANGVRHSFGPFDSPEAAGEAYLKAKGRLHDARRG